MKAKIKLRSYLYPISFIILSIIILYPVHLHELFYYDDNPIRYAIAKMLVEGKLDPEQKKVLLIYGSADPYIPIFFIWKLLGQIIDKQNYQNYYPLIYNIMSISYFLLGLTLIRRNTNFYPYILALFSILGIICVVRGSVHWFISSAIAIHIISADREKKIHYILGTIMYIISPNIIVFTSIFILWSFILRYKIGISKVFAISLLISMLKFLIGIQIMGYDILESIKNIEYFRSIFSYPEQREFYFRAKLFLPPSSEILQRFIKGDFIEVHLPLSLTIYIIFSRLVLAFLSERSLKVFATFLAGLIFYSFTVFSIFSIYLWTKDRGPGTVELYVYGERIPIFLAVFAVFLSTNPFRFFPLFVAWGYIITAEKNKINGKYKYIERLLIYIILSLFFFRACASLISYPALPEKVPDEVKNIISIIKQEVDSECQIIAEGDIHIIQNNKIIHPLYGGHMIAYIVAESEKNFYGSILPWEDNYFIAGHFRFKPIENSDIYDFIKEKGICWVLCWTEECKSYFSRISFESYKSGKFSLIRVNLKDKDKNKENNNNKTIRNKNIKDYIELIENVKHVIRDTIDLIPPYTFFHWLGYIWKEETSFAYLMASVLKAKSGISNPYIVFQDWRIRYSPDLPPDFDDTSIFIENIIYMNFCPVFLQEFTSLLSLFSDEGLVRTWMTKNPPWDKLYDDYDEINPTDIVVNFNIIRSLFKSYQCLNDTENQLRKLCSYINHNFPDILGKRVYYVFDDFAYFIIFFTLSEIFSYHSPVEDSGFYDDNVSECLPILSNICRLKSYIQDNYAKIMHSFTCRFVPIDLPYILLSISSESTSCNLWYTPMYIDNPPVIQHKIYFSPYLWHIISYYVLMEFSLVYH